MIRNFQVLITFAIVTLFVSAGHAQDKTKGPKRTTINFEDQLIKGQNQKPDLLYLLQKKQFNYKRLIRLREDFLPEMRESMTEIEEGSRIQLKQPNKE